MEEKNIKIEETTIETTEEITEFPQQSTFNTEDMSVLVEEEDSNANENN